VAVAVGLGDDVALGGIVSVGGGVNVSPAGWKGVGVALAFGSTVTRLRRGDDAAGSELANVQEARSVKAHTAPKHSGAGSTLRARRVRKVILVGCCKVGSDQIGNVHISVLAQDGEEIIRSGNASIHLGTVVL